jgi:Pyruvate/2-oxoacid:ferredoxin oxidoreductase gamma subunit
MPNTALLGAFVGLTEVVSLAALQRAIRDRFRGEAGEQNAALAADGLRGAREHTTKGDRRAQAG